MEPEEDAVPMDHFGDALFYYLAGLKPGTMLSPNLKYMGTIGMDKEKAPTFKRSQTTPEQLPSDFKRNGWWW